MAKFNDEQLNYFQATKGAYSEVTEREATGDKSVTVDKLEKEVIATICSLDSFARGGGGAMDIKPDTLTFNVWSEGTYLKKELVIKYPKSQGNELRLYFKKGSGFYPEFGEVWFIFVIDGVQELFIGSMMKDTFNNLTSTDAKKIAYEVNNTIDEEDFNYIKAINAPKAHNEAASYYVTSQHRDVTLAAQVMRRKNYTCEFSKNHSTFTSASTDHPYVEIHHLIPISNNKDFAYSLDVQANLIVLCPNCHRAIHYGDAETKLPLIKTFYKKRKAALASSGIEVDFKRLLSFYGIN
ncbi:HNH endonuclease [Catenovulum adriaticum]|uniref:HNH endonuclease n=1 Tax=Catenovulum adriaticum TaxID=2984846 RepID=A0ABY7AJ44_9ALTE|nr:HNH endonuclease [Catenovulum sp. TS8]WAJ69524.1 HNH endonuclease [Catenovulum sp. TS8]